MKTYRRIREALWDWNPKRLRRLLKQAKTATDNNAYAWANCHKELTEMQRQRDYWRNLFAYYTDKANEALADLKIQDEAGNLGLSWTYLNDLDEMQCAPGTKSAGTQCPSE